MKTTVAILALTLGCTAEQRARIAASQQQQRQAQAAQDTVIVTPGDISGRQYRILGPVEWPGQGNIALFGSGCDPNRLRREAVEKFGSQVGAVIGYTQWKDGQQMRCGGLRWRSNRRSRRNLLPRSGLARLATARLGS